METTISDLSHLFSEKLCMQGKWILGKHSCKGLEADKLEQKVTLILSPGEILTEEDASYLANEILARVFPFAMRIYLRWDQGPAIWFCNDFKGKRSYKQNTSLLPT